MKAPDDIEMEFFRNKRNQRMVRSTHYIATKTGHEIKGTREWLGVHTVLPQKLSMK